MKTLVLIQQDGSTLEYKNCKDDFSVHSSGKWGYLYDGLGGSAKVEFKENAEPEVTKIESWDGIENTADVFIGKEYLFVTGRVKKGEEKFEVVGVYDFDRNLKYILGSTEKGIQDDTIGSITSITDTPNGIIGLDSNMRTFMIWKKDGSFVAKTKASDLCSLDYPWFTNMQVLSDGSFLLAATQDRDDDSAMELVIYTVKGF